MHAAAKAQLRAIQSNAMQAPRGAARVDRFLTLLGPVHNTWHTTRHTYGFLLFHWDLINCFKAVGGPASFGGITAFTNADFRAFGMPYSVRVAVARGDINALESFSLAIERWHGAAHMAVGQAEGVDMMNPLTNIRLKQFWRLHYFINGKFEGKLRAYRQRTNQDAAAVIAGIEASNHAYVPFI